MLARAAPLRGDDDPAEPLADVDHLGEQDVAPAHAEAEAHRLVDVRPRDRQQHLADRLRRPGAECVRGLEVDVVHRVHRRDHLRQQEDDEGERQEHHLLRLAGAEQAQGERHQRRDRQVGTEHRERRERRLDLGERAHQHAERERQRHRDREAEQHPPERDAEVAGEGAVEPERADRAQHLERRRQDGRRDHPRLRLAAGGDRGPGEQQHEDRDDPEHPGHPPRDLLANGKPATCTRRAGSGARVRLFGARSPEPGARLGGFGVCHLASGGYTEISTRRLSAWFIGSSASAGSSHALPSTRNLLGSNLNFLTSACLTEAARSSESCLTSS